MTPFQTEKSSLFAYELLFGGEAPEGAMMGGRKKAINLREIGWRVNSQGCGGGEWDR